MIVERGQRITEHIVVGTPGKISDLIRKRAIDMKNINIFVLDEADVMLDKQGLKDQTLRIQRLIYIPLSNTHAHN